jgi:hypothetical protein
MKQLQCKFDDDISEYLDLEAVIRKKSKNEVVNDILRESFNKKKHLIEQLKNNI